MRRPQHTTRARRLIPKEASKYRRIREQIEREKPEISARVRQRIANLQALDKIFQELKRIREERGLTLSDMQRLTGIDRSAICKLETGRRANFTIDTIVRYAQAVGKKLVLSLANEK